MIPVKFSHSNTPIIDADVEGKIYPLMLDLGSIFSLSLDKDLLEKINKQACDLVKWRDWKGTPYESLSYLIPKVNLYGLEWTKVVAKETNRQQNTAGVLWDDKPETLCEEEFKGKIGLPLLKKTNLCLDFCHQAIFSCNSLKTLQSKGICPKNMIQIPFYLKKGVLIVHAETEVGQFNLIVDTGATVSVIKSSLIDEMYQKKDQRGLPFVISSYLKLSRTDFGELNFYLCDLDRRDEIEGILGMDFLKRHIIYIDYPNKVLYIENPI